METKYRLTIVITETYTPKDDEEYIEYQKVIQHTMKEAAQAARWKLKQRLGKSVSIEILNE